MSQGTSPGEFSEVLLHGLILDWSVEHYPGGDFDGLDARAAWGYGNYGKLRLLRFASTEITQFGDLSKSRFQLI